MANPELDRLLVTNLPDLEAAACHVTGILQPAVAEALDDKLEEAISRSGWLGNADYEADDFWIAPAEWRKPGAEDDDLQCWFEMDISDGDWDETEFWLAALVGVGARISGMRWSRNVPNKRLWRKQLSEQAGVIARLRVRGFEFQEASSSFFMPVRIDRGKLAEAVGEESPEMALEPFDAAVQACIDAKADFDELIAACPIEGGRLA